MSGEPRPLAGLFRAMNVLRVDQAGSRLASYLQLSSRSFEIEQNSQSSKIRSW